MSDATPLAKVRAKMKVTEITRTAWNPAYATIKLTAEYDQNIPEDMRFYEATPSGEFTMLVGNQAAIDALELGKSFYIDMIPITDQ